LCTGRYLYRGRPEECHTLNPADRALTPLGEAIGAMQTVREAALRPSSCDRYPYLPARMWTKAKALADLVARYGARPVKTGGGRWRMLSDRDFSFRRGGVSRHMHDEKPGAAGS
jgi:hypothetical protein